MNTRTRGTISFSAMGASGSMKWKPSSLIWTSARPGAVPARETISRAERRPSRARERADDLARDDEVDRDLDRLVRVDVVGLAQELAGERVLVDADRGAADLHVDARELEVRVERDRVDGLDDDVEAHGPGEAEVEVREEALEAPATRNGPHQRRSRVRRARFGRDVVRATRENTQKRRRRRAAGRSARGWPPSSSCRRSRRAPTPAAAGPRARRSCACENVKVSAKYPSKASKLAIARVEGPKSFPSTARRVRCGRRRKTARPRGGCRARAAGSRGRAP